MYRSVKYIPFYFYGAIMIELLNNPGIIMFIFLWISGIIMYGYSKDKMVLEYAMSYSFLYGIYILLKIILT